MTVLVATVTVATRTETGTELYFCDEREKRIATSLNCFNLGALTGESPLTVATMEEDITDVTCMTPPGLKAEAGETSKEM